MIIVEFLIDVLLNVSRFFVWIITARDCNHCKHYQRGFLGDYVCKKKSCEIIDCLGSVTRKNFERESEETSCN